MLNSLRAIKDGRAGYRWRIYDRNQRRLAPLTESRPFAPFAVHGKHLVIADGRKLGAAGGHPRELRVRSLSTGDVVWRTLIGNLLTPRDTE